MSEHVPRIFSFAVRGGEFRDPERPGKPLWPHHLHLELDGDDAERLRVMLKRRFSRCRRDPRVTLFLDVGELREVTDETSWEKREIPEGVPTAGEDTPERRRELALRYLEESDFRGSSERSIRANLPPETLAALEEHGASELFDGILRAYIAEAERFALALYIERLTVAELEALRAWSTSPLAGKLREIGVDCAADLRELSRKHFGNLELEPKEGT